MIMQFITSLLITFLITASAIVAPVSAVEIQKGCCCSALELSAVAEAFMQNGCTCCTPGPLQNIPDKTIQIQNKPKTSILPLSKSFILTNKGHLRTHIIIDYRRPLHLASNELYLKKRALLI